METCQFSKPPEVQGAVISWQDNVLHFLGCWRCIAYGLTKWQLQAIITLTYFKNYMSQLKKRAKESWLRYRYPFFCMTINLLIRSYAIWRNASSTIFSSPGTKWLPSVSNFEETLPWIDRLFLTDNELKYTTEEWLKKESELFYFTGIKQLRYRY